MSSRTLAAPTTTTPFDLDALDASIDPSSPLAGQRRGALAAFRARGLPTARDEAWRFTSLSALQRGRFDAAPRPDASTLAAVEQRLAQLRLPAGPRVVLVNGWVVSRTDHVSTIADAVARDQCGGLATVASPGGSAFTALNTAALHDGALVRVPAGVVVREPIVVVSVSAPNTSPLLAQPRTLVALGRGAQATVVEVHVALEPDATPAPRVVHNGITELLVEDGARLEHVLLQLEDDDAVRVHGVHARVSRDSGLGLHTHSLGGRLVRNDLRVLLDGQGAEARLRGLYLARDGQHVDDHVFLDHAHPHGTSDQVFKGVLAGTGHAVFDGQVHVREDAQKTAAHQTNRNLLLSDKAVINANPRLTIHADDVKCSHGATIGQLDPIALFYLRSRGLSKDAARGLLTLAFALEVVDALPANVRGWVGDLVRARLAPDLHEVPT